MEGDDGTLGRRLTERDICDGTSTAKDAYASLPAAREGCHALDYVAASGDLHDVGSEGVGAVPVYDDGGFGLVLRPGRPTPGPAPPLAIQPGGYRHQFHAISTAAIASVVVGITDIFTVSLLASIEAPLVVLGFGLLQLLVEVVMEVSCVEWRRKMMSMC